MQKLKRLTIVLCFLFSLPLFIGQLPFPNNELVTEKKEQPHYVFAATEVPTVAQQEIEPFHVLLVYTHSHESYKPVVEQAKGLQAVYDESTNIYSMQQMMAHYLQLYEVTAHTVDFDVMTEMKRTNASFYQAYQVARPVLATHLQQKDYDLIIDFHRDSASKKVTTLQAGDESFAKVAFVVGAAHAGFESNLAYANALSDQMNALVPGISRGILKKQGAGVDGVYNQDLAPNMLLIELGGIDNTEEELQRTMAVLAQAIHFAFKEAIV